MADPVIVKTTYFNQLGQKHRLNGAAIEWTDGRKKWFVDGKECTELQHKFLIDLLKLKEILC